MERQKIEDFLRVPFATEGSGVFVSGGGGEEKIFEGEGERRGCAERRLCGEWGLGEGPCKD